MRASRIDRLAPAEKKLLQTLAVLGREFTLALVPRAKPRSSDELEQMLSRRQLGEFINQQSAVGEGECKELHHLCRWIHHPIGVLSSLVRFITRE